MFEKIIAQDKAKKILSEQIKNNKIPHAYIFMGEEGASSFLSCFPFFFSITQIFFSDKASPRTGDKPTPRRGSRPDPRTAPPEWPSGCF